MDIREFEQSASEVGRMLGQLLRGAGAQVAVTWGRVTKVRLDDGSDDEYTMDIRLPNDRELMGIGLGVVGGGKMSVLCVPAVGSLVAFASPMGNQSSMFPIAYERLDKTVVRYNLDEDTDSVEVDADGITAKRGDYTCILDKKNISLACADKGSLVLENDTITMNDGDLGGLVKINDLTKRLNNIESDINNLKNAFSSWQPVANDGGAALKTGTTAWAGQILTQTKNSDYENTKVKQ